MEPRFSYLAALLSLVACSPDLSLLSGQASFAGTSAGGDDPTANAGSPSGGLSGGGSATAGEAASGGDGSDNPRADGGAAGAPAPAPCVATGAESCNAKDDDCNGIVDDGCPSGVTTTFEKDLQPL